MFTVVIAEKEHLDQIRENSTFLSPFIDRNNVAFCQWLPEEETIRDCVPMLEQTVRRRDRWRALIVATEAGIDRKNPFDLVEYHPPVREFDKAPMPEPTQEEPSGKAKAMDLSEITDVEGKILNKRLDQYLAALKKAKFSAYEQASRNALTRLVTALCQSPMVTSGINRAADDPEFQEYLAEYNKKQELRQAILGTERLSITLPAEVYCIARRTYQNEAYDIPTSWVPHVDLHYSKFGDRNMYFDKMRYFVFDILPKNHQNYTFDYLRFLYATLILAGHELEGGMARAGILYRLDCINDNDALDRLLSGYEAKLNATAENLERRINDLKQLRQERLSDQQAASIFCGSVLVPVVPDREVRQQELYAHPEAFSLSADCPEPEEYVWKEQYQTSQRTLRKYLKQPRRALKRATGDLRQMNEADVDKALLLNEFQLEDIQEHISSEELRMIGIETPGVYDTSAFDERLKQEDRKVRDILETRMTRKITVGLGLTALLLVLIGFLPAIFNNAERSDSLLTALLLILGTVALFALVCYICLFFLRRTLRRGVRDYNRTMAGIQGEINDGMLQYSSYLSRACNVMRGYSTLNYCRRNEPAGTREIRILRKHIGDIRATRAALEDTFGRFITGKYPTNGADTEPYDYEFTRTVDFHYPMPYNESESRRVEFVESGSYITLPVSFVNAVVLRREELYD